MHIQKATSKKQAADFDYKDISSDRPDSSTVLDTWSRVGLRFDFVMPQVICSCGGPAARTAAADATRDNPAHSCADTWATNEKTER